tara:strand:- start:3373 stop:4755 length:1383 start_codon:yes stop_codon:yes gene_type:complete
MKNIWEDAQQKAFVKIAGALNEAKIHWTVLRNYDGLPAYNDSKDIDISLRYSERKKALKLIETSLLACGFVFKKEIRFSFCYSLVYFKMCDGNVDSIKIDLFWGLQLKGYLMQSPDDLYANSIDLGFFKGADKSISAVFNLTTSIVANGILRDKYFNPLVAEYKKNKLGVKKWLSSIMDEEMQMRLENDIQSSNIGSIKKYIPELRASIKRATFKKQPLEIILRSISRWYYRLQQFINDSGGGFISFHGADGSGKTTVINEFIKQYSDVFVIDRQAISLQHFRPHFLPNARAIVAGSKYDESKEEYHNPHRGKNKSFFPSFFALCYYCFDYIVGYFFRTKKEILFHNTVIYDRYIYDFLTDPQRMSITLPYFIRKIFVYALPRPFVSFYLDGPAKLIYSRKKELTLDAITTQNNIYRNKLAKNKRFVTLDILQNPEEIATTAIISYIKKTCIILISDNNT